MDENQQKQPGEASEILVNINSGLNQLGSIIDSSQLPDEDKAKFQNLYATFMDFADNLGQAPGQKKQMPGNVPAETMGRPARPAL
jgi:hypothetical protein